MMNIISDTDDVISTRLQPCSNVLVRFFVSASRRIHSPNQVGIVGEEFIGADSGEGSVLCAHSGEDLMIASS